jgi:pilus assembly protein CpaB
MKNKRRIAGIITALILATVGTVTLAAYMRDAKNDAVAQEAMVGVYVVDTLVPQGAEPDMIKSSVSLVQVPARLKQQGAITDLDAVGSNVAATDLQPGDQLLEARLASKERVSGEVTDKVQISVLLEAQRAVGGSLEEGDLVGVYLSFDPFDLYEDGASTPAEAAEPPEAPTGTDVTSTTLAAQKKSPNMTRLEFQHVLVTKVQTTDAPLVADGDDTNGVAQVSAAQFVVTLALSPEQSERFVFATEFGHVWLSNQPATVSDDGTRLVTLGNVYSVVE